MPYKDKTKRYKYQSEWVKSRRTAWLAENGPCVKCLSSEDLQIDHVDRKDKVSHRIWSWSKNRRDLELEKCQVLCNKCHVVKTYKEIHPRERTGRAILTENDVKDIRQLIVNGMLQIEVAKLYRVSKSCVSAIARREHWKFVE